MENLQRIIQESVPGKQITLLHLISSPDPNVNDRIGVKKGSLGILTLTPTESSIIAADIASKSANVEIAFVDRFNGAVLINGDVEGVHTSLLEVQRYFKEFLGFNVCEVTKS